MSGPIRLKYIFLAGKLSRSSVFNKVTCQIRSLNSHGIDTQGWFFNTLEGEEGNGELDSDILKIGLPKYPKQHRFFHNYYRHQYHLRFIKDYVSEHAGEYDAVLLRHSGNGRAYEELLRTIGKKLFLYVPSNTIREKYCERRYTTYHSTLSALFGWWEHLRYWIREKRLLRKHYSSLGAVITFTPEFGRLIAAESKKPIVNIYNRDGANTSAVPARSSKKRDSKEIQLIFLKGSGQQQKWAGLDRLIRSIEAYPDLPIRLYITGNAINEKERYGRPFVTLTGRLPFDELEELIDEVDLGVSNLENYLIHFNETTNLKSRDYYSRGLPFIQSNTMPDIEGTEAAQYYLHIPNDDSIIDMQKVYDFALQMRADVDHPRKMHEFAVEHLDWNVTVGELAQDIKSLI